MYEIRDILKTLVEITRRRIEAEVSELIVDALERERRRRSWTS
jgi:hypothetical protein